jgi:hypothetical protein
VSTIDLITAAGPSSDGFLHELAGSIHEQHVPAGWSVRWLVVCDGPDASANAARARLADELGAHRTWSNHDRYWAGASRNRALAHSDAEWIQAVDADDVLCPGAVAAWVREARTRSTWCSFRAVDWYPVDGRTRAFPSPFPPGPITAGEWLRHYERTGRHPVHPLAILWPRALLVRVGGWAAAPSAEDAAVAFLGTSLCDGWAADDVVIRYRKHPAQDTHGGRDRPVESAAADARLLAVRRAREWLHEGA